MRAPIKPIRSSISCRNLKREKLNGHLLLEYLLELRDSGYDIRAIACTANFKRIDQDQEKGEWEPVVTEEIWQDVLYRYDAALLEYKLYQEANTNIVGVKL